MKNLSRYCAILMLLFVSATLYGQGNLPDVKRSAEEQAIFEKSVPVNPAKIPAGSTADPKQDPSGISNVPVVWKPVVSPVDDRRDQDLNKAVPSSSSGMFHPIGNNVQPLAPKPANPVNHRNITGSKTQPEAPKASAIDYRSLQGPKTQPAGEKPKR